MMGLLFLQYDTVKKYLVIKRNVDFAVTFTTNGNFKFTNMYDYTL